MSEVPNPLWQDADGFLSSSQDLLDVNKNIASPSMSPSMGMPYTFASNDTALNADSTLGNQNTPSTPNNWPFLNPSPPFSTQQRQLQPQQAYQQPQQMYQQQQQLQQQHQQQLQQTAPYSSQQYTIPTVQMDVNKQYQARKSQMEMTMGHSNFVQAPVSTAKPVATESGVQKKKRRSKKVTDSYKQKHNLSEQRRRGRLRKNFSLLKEVAQCGRKDQVAILEEAITLLKSYEKRIKFLEDENKRMFMRPDSVVHDFGRIAARLKEHQDSKGEVALPVDSEDTVTYVMREFKTMMQDDVLGELPCCLINRQGRFLDCSQSFTKFLGYERDELVNSPKLSVFSLTHQEDISPTLAMFRDQVSPEVPYWTLFKKCVTKDSEVVSSHVMYCALGSQTTTDAGMLPPCAQNSRMAFTPSHYVAFMVSPNTSS
jgi:PAS domain-containing protein